MVETGAASLSLVHHKYPHCMHANLPSFVITLRRQHKTSYNSSGDEDYVDSTGYKFQHGGMALCQSLFPVQRTGVLKIRACSISLLILLMSLREI